MSQAADRAYERARFFLADAGINSQNTLYLNPDPGQRRLRLTYRWMYRAFIIVVSDEHWRYWWDTGAKPRRTRPVVQRLQTLTDDALTELVKKLRDDGAWTDQPWALTERPGKPGQLTGV